MTAPATSFMATDAALCGSVMPSAMWRSTFSMTTMASSTTSPVASVMPNSVRVLMEKPSSLTKMKAPINETGMVTAGINVLRQSCKKYKDDEDDQHDGLQQSNQHVANGFADHRGGVECHGIFQAGRKRF